MELDLNISILCLNETKLDSSISDDELKIYYYVFVRRDHTRHGGGICKTGIKYKLVRDLITDHIEVLWLEIDLPKFDPFLLCSTYRPPNSYFKYRDALFNNFQQAANLNPNLLILGDFNENILGGVEGTYVDYLCSLLELKQLVKTATRVTLNSKSLIDFILSSF